jgi:hypothetical protein
MMKEFNEAQSTNEYLVEQLNTSAQTNESD